MKIIAASHLDHGLPVDVAAYIAERFADPRRFLHRNHRAARGAPVGEVRASRPMRGDAPISDLETWYELRGNRRGPTRFCARPLRVTRLVTVVAGPINDEPWRALHSLRRP